MREVRVSVELSRTPKRVWLKVRDSEGHAEIHNILAWDAARIRNRLVEALAEDYDVVISEPIPKRGRAPRLERVVDSKGELKP